MRSQREKDRKAEDRGAVRLVGRAEKDLPDPGRQVVGTLQHLRENERGQTEKNLRQHEGAQPQGVFRELGGRGLVVGRAENDKRA